MERNKTKLHDLLLKRRLSQIELMDLVKTKFPETKMNYPMVNKIVTGKNRNPNLRSILMISIVLGVTLDEIVDIDLVFN